MFSIYMEPSWMLHQQLEVFYNSMNQKNPIVNRCRISNQILPRPLTSCVCIFPQTQATFYWLDSWSLDIAEALIIMFVLFLVKKKNHAHTYAHPHRVPHVFQKLGEKHTLCLYETTGLSVRRFAMHYIIACII